MSAATYYRTMLQTQKMLAPSVRRVAQQRVRGMAQSAASACHQPSITVDDTLGRIPVHVMDDPSLFHSEFITNSSTSTSTTTSTSTITGSSARTSIEVQLADEQGSLAEVLRLFDHRGVNMTRIDSKPDPTSFTRCSFKIDCEGDAADPRVQALLRDLQLSARCMAVEVPERAQEVEWFPRHISDLDMTTDTLDGGTDLINDDHPGFHDKAYLARREALVANAKAYRHGQPIPRVAYTPEEVQTWGVVYDRLKDLSARHACREYREVMPLLEAHCGFSRDNVPQLEDISAFLKARTGFTLRPVAGLLSARDFLNALAFRVFFSTQYIRHHSKPLYTPEPDVCHELLGHVPLFADPDFADFSQKIGLASLGASDADIDRLANNYWFTVEFGLCQEAGELKAFGAGLLSSFGEMEYACSPVRPAGGVEHSPELKPFDPLVAGVQPYPITEYQPTYFVVDSLADLKAKMGAFCDEEVASPFHCRHDPAADAVVTDRAVVRLDKTSTLAAQAEKQKAYFQEKLAQERGA